MFWCWRRPKWPNFYGTTLYNTKHNTYIEESAKCASSMGVFQRNIDLVYMQKKGKRMKKTFRKCPHFLLGMLYLICVTIMCRNDDLSWTMSWIGCLLKDSGIFILFAENSQILLKISVIPIFSTFMYLVALNLLVNNQLNSLSNSTHHWSS